MFESDEHSENLGHEFFAALGRMAAAWAGFEITVHMNIEVIRLLYGGEKIERQFPEQISRKLRYLLKAYRTIPELTQHTETALMLIERAKNLSEERHFAIHGVAITTLNHTTAEFLRRRNDTGAAVDHVKVISTRRLLEIAVDMREISLHLSAITLKLMKKALPEIDIE